MENKIDNSRYYEQQPNHFNDMPDWTFIPEQPQVKPDYKFKPIRSSLLRMMPPPEFLVEGIMHPKDVGILVAPSASGKTFVALNLAYAFATGSEFAGRFQVNRQMSVLYVFGEGSGGMIKRVEAVEEQFGYSEEKHARVDILDKVPNLCDKGDVGRFIDEMQAHSLKPDFIIIDTLHTAIPGYDDSSNRDMGLMYQSAKRIRDTFECVIMLVHHTGKNGEYRGASSLFGDADFFIGIDGDKDASVKTLAFDKIKDGERPNGIKFELVAKCNSMMVRWLPDNVTTYTPAQLWYFENIISALADDKDKWLSAVEIGKLTPRSEKASGDDGHNKAIRRYLDILQKDAYVSVQDGESRKNGKEIKLYQYLKDAPRRSAYEGEIEI